MNNFLYEDIVTELQNQIESGQLIEGEKLPSERMMAEKYGVSRNVIREALKVLSEKGLIYVQPGRGGFVRILENKPILDKLELAIYSSKSTLMEILEVREIVEKAIVQKAVEKATTKNIEKLKQIYENMEAHLISHTNFAAEDAKFHIELSNCTNNNMLKILITSFYNITDKKLFLISQLYPDNAIQGQKEHKSIIDAIENRNLDQALEAIQNHMNCIRTQLENLEEKNRE